MKSGGVSGTEKSFEVDHHEFIMNILPRRVTCPSSSQLLLSRHVENW